MEMQQVRYFITVAKTLNFTRAAEECNVTQPALTRAIKLLEYELGGDLIRREGRHSHLTDLGKKMLPILQQCHEAALAARSLAKAVSKGDISTLTIAVSRTLDTVLILSPLREMYTVFPGLQLKLKRGTALEIAALLKSGEADMAIGGTLNETWDRLESWTMFSESFDLLVSANHPLTMLNPLDLQVDLIREERFLIQSNADLSEYELGRLTASGVNLHSAHEVDSDHDMEKLVAAGFGIGIASSRSMYGPNVRQLEFPAFDIMRSVAVYTVAGRQKSREVNTLLNLLRGKDWS
jgi:DNA-binding transcriptional LysR family regulator